MFSRTDRLLLRPGWLEDAPALQAAIADPAVIRNLASAPWPYGPEDAQAFLSAPRDPKLPDFLAFSRTRGAPRLIGGCGIQRDADGRLVLGYWIARPFWGLGFATEASAAVMRIARATGLGRVSASHFIDNPSSGRVLRKVGFHPTGRIEKEYSRGRADHVLAAQFEDSGVMPMRADLSASLYMDRPPIAA